MRLVFLGTGTSHGVPMLGCSCPVCLSDDEHDKRYRSSVLLEKDGKRIVIDTGYEFRLALLREGVKSIDAVLYTHAHADHMAGIDDLRVFSQKQPFDIYSSSETIDYIDKHYHYAIARPDFPGIPHLRPNVLVPYRSYEIASFPVMAIPIEHGRMTHMPIYGYRIGKLAYLTDCTFIPPESYEALQGIEVLVIGALRKREHGAHFSFEEAHEAGRKMGAKRIFFTHINHETFAREIDSLYEDAFGAYDTLSIEIGD